MEVNDSLIDKLADLSRLRFEGEERAKIKADLLRMLDFVRRLEEIDVDETAPLVHLTDEPLELRPDEVTYEITQQEALKNAPLHDSDYFKVPKVLDQN